MIKNAQCLRLTYDNRTGSGEFELNTRLQFSAQDPIDKTLLQRAIIVRFDAKGEDERLQLSFLCRVIFEFSSPDELLEGEELLRRHRKDAYQAATEMVNRVVTAMGQGKVGFPEL